MKNIMLLVLSSATLISSFSFAREVATLTKVEMDPKMDVSYGAATVSVDEQKVNLELKPTTIACFTAPCPQLPTRQIEVPVVSKTTDGCGSSVIVAQVDQRPVDGALIQVTLVDHRSRLCEDYRPFMTEVTLVEQFYDRLHSSEIKLESHLSGGPLSARAYSSPVVSVLKNFRISDDSSLALKEASNGTLRITQDTVNLSLYNYGVECLNMEMTGLNHCPPAPRANLVLPILSQKIDSCGMIETIAQSDKRPVDGAIKTLDIKDYAHSNCKEQSGYHTVVTFSEGSLRVPPKATAQMSGEALTTLP